jgi:hypothetical protein
VYPLLRPFFKRLKNILFYTFDLALQIHNSAERRSEYSSSSQPSLPFTHKFYPQITSYLRDYYKNLVTTELEACHSKTLDIISTSQQLFRIKYIFSKNCILAYQKTRNYVHSDINKLMDEYYLDIKDYVSYNATLLCYNALAAELYSSRAIFIY